MTVLLAATVATLIASLGLTRLVLGQLRRHAILDHPNERSSHAAPTPRGGGIAVVAVVVTAWTVPMLPAPDPGTTAVIIAAVALAGLSWADDLLSLPPLARLLVQALIVAATMAWLEHDRPIFQGLLPAGLDLLMAGLLWLWFTNLFNFMDGIDAISAVEATALGLGFALLALLLPAQDLDPWHGLSIAAAVLGFLWWNRPPARIFLGDVGSVPLGFLLGWLMLRLAASGLWAAALILPLYYLADATITLLRRAARGKKIWRPHREHFYQRAVQSGRSHGAVSAAVALGDAVLVVLAVVAIEAPWLALAAAAAVVAMLMLWMRR